MTSFPAAAPSTGPSAGTPSTLTAAPATAAPEDPFGSAGWAALGTFVQLVVAGGSTLPAAQASAERILADVDRTCSRFRPDSDLTRANAAAGRWVRVDPLLAGAVLAALRAAEATGGLVDPTLGREIVALGYDRTFAELGHDAEEPAEPGVPRPAHRPPEARAATGIPEPALRGGWWDVEVDPEGAVRVPAGTALDLGATGKAYAADLVASHLAREHGVACVVSIGGDVAVGRPEAGRGPEKARAQAWPVRVCETPDDDAGETVVLTDGGLATSTTLRRRWTRDGATLHHLLDPRTGRPVEQRWRTASVAAATCVEANTASTAAVILGDEAPAWLHERALPARLVDRDGEVVHCCGWPQEEQGAGRWSSS